ncbi:MAG: pilus assembly PilX N-terminal domain-containing protein [Acidiferrobacterales bacterium]|nr:pilus assembly PilX N-terminal domain-containing protein [Acidiferrobacterales bacterium]
MTKTQKGIALVIALVLLTSMTIVGVSSVSSGLMQTKMANNQNMVSMAFDAAEASVEGVVHEGGSGDLRQGQVLDGDGNPVYDSLTVARTEGQVGVDNQIDLTNLPTCDELANAIWSERRLTSAGLQDDQVHNNAGTLMDVPPINAWSKTGFVGLKNLTDPTTGLVSSIVDTDGARNRTLLEVFVVKGCGHVEGSAVNAVSRAMLSRQTLEIGDTE